MIDVDISVGRSYDSRYDVRFALLRALLPSLPQLGSDDAAERGSAEVACGPRLRPWMIPSLVGGLWAFDEQSCAASARALGMLARKAAYGDRFLKAVPALLQALRNPLETVQEAVAEALGEIAPVSGAAAAAAYEFREAKARALRRRILYLDFAFLDSSDSWIVQPGNLGAERAQFLGRGRRTAYVVWPASAQERREGREPPAVPAHIESIRASDYSPPDSESRSWAAGTDRVPRIGVLPKSRPGGGFFPGDPFPPGHPVAAMKNVQALLEAGGRFDFGDPLEYRFVLDDAANRSWFRITFQTVDDAERLAARLRARLPVFVVYDPSIRPRPFHLEALNVSLGSWAESPDLVAAQALGSPSFAGAAARFKPETGDPLLFSSCDGDEEAAGVAVLQGWGGLSGEQSFQAILYAFGETGTLRSGSRLHRQVYWQEYRRVSGDIRDGGPHVADVWINRRARSEVAIVMQLAKEPPEQS